MSGRLLTDPKPNCTPIQPNTIRICAIVEFNYLFIKLFRNEMQDLVFAGLGIVQHRNFISLCLLHRSDQIILGRLNLQEQTTFYTG